MIITQKQYYFFLDNTYLKILLTKMKPLLLDVVKENFNYVN
jgi:hypothetical protein